MLFVVSSRLPIHLSRSRLPLRLNENCRHLSFPLQVGTFVLYSMLLDTNEVLDQERAQNEMGHL